MIDDRLFGVYKAIVTDTACFKTTGKIKTRISAFNGGYCPKNLLDSYDSGTFSKVINRDILTDIMMPFGGGYDYGMFKLPPINSVGLVAFIDGSRSTPVWLGGTANLYLNEENQLYESDVPSDRDNGYGAVYYDENSKTEENQSGIVYNMYDENAFILKTKTNILPNPSTPETMDWKKNPVQNAFIASATGIKLWHRINNEGAYQEFSLFCDENIQDNPETKDVDESEDAGYINLEYYIDENQYKHFRANNKSIDIISKDGQIEGKIKISDDGEIYIASIDNSGKGSQSASGSSVTSEITMNSAKIEINSGGSHISLIKNVDRQQEKIEISTSGSIQINAQKVSFGPDGYNFVLSPNANLNFTLEDGSMLTTSNNIRI